ncbi:MAG TPA: nucleotidyltransferase domain-containing protein [Steroidobacteraceae bacterium]|jgi:predicted nucleotidyltransferase|nr:nucleotidyltransferase domain-containing protein [Steroidobacteraceae bacterium]
MNRAKILRTLSRHVGEIEGRFRIKTLSLFGPAARNEWRKGANIDVLVEFEGAPTFDRYMDLKLYLEELTGAPVGLLTVDAVKPRMWPAIESSLIHVA